MPCAAWSIAIAWVSALTAPFDVLYAVSPRGRMADTDEMLTIEPPPLAAIDRDHVLGHEHHALDVCVSSIILA